MKKTVIFFALMLTVAASSLVVGAPMVEAQHELMIDTKEYIGIYKVFNLPFEKVIVTEKDGKLHYVAGDYEGDFSEVTGKPDSYSANGQAIVTFIRDTDGKVTKLKLEAQGEVFEGIREAIAASLADYIGKYKAENLPFEFVILTLKGNMIQIEAGDNQGMLEPVANKVDTFDAGGQATIRFERNGQNEVVKMLIDAQGQTFVAMPMK